MLGSLATHSTWIIWNLCLAFIPMVLSIWLFRYPQSIQKLFPRRLSSRRGISLGLWWLGLLVFIAFLPNAPYLLTDIIHLILATRSVNSIWVITLVIIPVHVLAILSGFEAYVIALINQGAFWRKIGLGKYILPAELLLHIICSIGIYLGRFRRYNSWDLVTTPRTVLHGALDDLTSHWPILVIGITFIVLTVLYWVFKQITLGLVLRYQSTRSLKPSQHQQPRSTRHTIPLVRTSSKNK
jgi:uncharacterized membrane protein